MMQTKMKYFLRKDQKTSEKRKSHSYIDVRLPEIGKASSEIKEEQQNLFARREVKMYMPISNLAAMALILQNKIVRLKKEGE